MNGGGPGSGIWKSTDGGETWTRLKTGASGGIARPHRARRLPASGPNILYASIEGPRRRARRRGRRRWTGRGSRRGRCCRCGTVAPGAAGAGGAGQRGGAGGAGLRRRARPRDRRRRQRDRASIAPTTAAPPGARSTTSTSRPMYFSQVRVDPNDPDVVVHGRRRAPAHRLDGGKTMATDVAEPTHDDMHAIWIDPHNSNHIADRQRRRSRAVVGPGQDVGLHSQPAGRPLLPRELRHVDAVQHLRRHAGQLRLVRPEPGARRGRHRQPRVGHDPGGRRLRRAAGSEGQRGSSTASRRTATSSASIA